LSFFSFFFPLMSHFPLCLLFFVSLFFLLSLSSTFFLFSFRILET